MTNFEARPEAQQRDTADEVARNKKYTIFEWGPQDSRQPMLVERAKGAHVWDASGNRYVDFNSQAVNVNIGHADDRVIAAMGRQLESLPYVSPFAATRARGEAGELLAAHTPTGLTKSFFTLGGAEANENAIRAAFAYTGRKKVLSRYRSYHGATNAMLQLSGDPRRWPAEPGLPGVVRFWGPYPFRDALRWGPEADSTAMALTHLEDVIVHEGPATIAAIIMEPVPGGYGAIVPPPGYLRGVRQLCDRYGILLIADEVMTGFGRTGQWFAVDHEEVVPDILTVGKGITSGHAPLGATVLSDAVSEFFEDRPFPGGLTFNGYPLGCAAAAATIRVFEDDDLVTRSAELGEVLASRLQEVHTAHDCVGDVRNSGLFGAVELVRSKDSMEPMGSIEGPNETQSVLTGLKQSLRDAGLLATVRGSHILIAPPLCISLSDLEWGIEQIDKALGSITR